MSESYCGSLRRPNVASFDCDMARKFPQKLIMGGKAFSAADCEDSETFKVALLAATMLDSGDENKLFPINFLLNPTDKTEANKEGAVGEGPKQVLVAGKPGFEYEVEIGQDLFKRLSGFNKQKIPVFTYDDAENLWGAQNSEGKFIGALAYFYISGNSQQTASAPVSAKISIAYLSEKQYNREAFYMPVELGEFEPAGLLDAPLSYISNVSNVFKIGMTHGTAKFNGAINLAKRYSTALVAGLFTAKTKSAPTTGYDTSLAITSVAYDSTLECLTVTFSSTPYTALTAGDKIKLIPGNVAAFVAADIVGIESDYLILTKS